MSERGALGLSVQAFSMQKDGSSETENEDAVEFGDDGHIVAVSDGATEGTDSRRWARFLVEKFCTLPVLPSATGEGTFSDSLRAWIDNAVSEWNDQARPEPSRISLPWYVGRAAERGSFASLIGARIDKSSAESQQTEASSPLLTVSAVAIGDSCAFVIRNGALVFSFPLTSVSDFQRRPQLLCTVGAQNRPAVESALTVNFTLQHGDSLVFMTDAMACWFLDNLGKEAELRTVRRQSGVESDAGSTAASGVIAYFVAGDSAVATQSAFATLVTQELKCGTLRNDDCTVVVVSATANREKGAEAE